MSKGVIICLTVLLVIFGSLALTFSLLGCDPTLQPNCLRYTIREIQITDYILEQDTCYSCNAWSDYCSVVTVKLLKAEHPTVNHGLLIYVMIHLLLQPLRLTINKKPAT